MPIRLCKKIALMTCYSGKIQSASAFSRFSSGLLLKFVGRGDLNTCYLFLSYYTTSLLFLGSHKGRCVRSITAQQPARTDWEDTSCCAYSYTGHAYKYSECILNKSIVCVGLLKRAIIKYLCTD